MLPECSEQFSRYEVESTWHWALVSITKTTSSSINHALSFSLLWAVAPSSSNQIYASLGSSTYGFLLPRNGQMKMGLNSRRNALQTLLKEVHAASSKLLIARLKFLSWSGCLTRGPTEFLHEISHQTTLETYVVSITIHWWFKFHIKFAAMSLNCW